MDSVAAQSSSQAPISASVPQSKLAYSYQSLVIGSTAASNDDAVSVSTLNGVQPLPLTAQEIVDRINDRLKLALPDGVQSLNPEEQTPEATSARIVSQITSLFDAYAKQNSNLSDEEVVSSFMEKVRAGVEQGYGDAYDFLESLGAFSIDGVKDGIEKTKALIGEKLQKFEDTTREALGLPKGGGAVQNSTQNSVSGGLLGQAGSGISSSLNLVA